MPMDGATVPMTDDLLPATDVEASRKATTRGGHPAAGLDPSAC
ncbi:MAG TPA: hypothetical protein VME46_10845 [Acidimicrobiales bacterium]|nr:hypothetical protein [Acidimicrobiales bacterium]